MVLFLGLGEGQESEGFDRTTIDLPADQIALAVRVLAANPRTVVVLCHGGALHVSVIDAPAVLDAALLGRRSVRAWPTCCSATSIPSGRLTETLPPPYRGHPGVPALPRRTRPRRLRRRTVHRLPLVRRPRPRRHLPVRTRALYTTFDYDNLAVESGTDGIRVTLRLTNSGARDGREIVQVYLGAATSSVSRRRAS